MITTWLSVPLAKIPQRTQFPTCPICGEGNCWHVTWPTAVMLACYLAASVRTRPLAGKQLLVIGCGAG